MSSINIEDRVAEILKGEPVLFQVMTQHWAPATRWLIASIPFLAAIAVTNYWLSVTAKGILFLRLNLVGAPTHHDFIAFDEISHFKHRIGVLGASLRFKFASGRALKLIAATLKLNKKAATLDDGLVPFLQNRIARS